MAPPSGESITLLMALAIGALGDTQESFGKRLGVSRRTISRWISRGGGPGMLAKFYDLARAVHPHDPKLAARIVASQGATLEDAGIVVPSEAVAPSLLLPPPPPPYLVEVVVCAAAEALDVSPRVVRPVLLAALRTARSLGLDVESMEKALTPGEAVAQGKKAKGGKG